MAKLIKERVKELLEAKPELRDSDNLLIQTIWEQELEAIGVDPKPFQPLFELIMINALTPVKSIERSRRLMQAKFVELQGKNYKGRNALQAEWKAEIKSEEVPIYPNPNI
jgi:hypothetical protein